MVSFLNKVNREGLSDSSELRIKALYRIVGELESLGDSGEAISRLISQAIVHSQKLSAEHRQSLDAMIELVFRAYDAMIYNLENATTITDISNALEAEVAINDMRDSLRDKEILRAENNGEAYFESMFYLNLIEKLEDMGDFIINVSQAVENWRTRCQGASYAWND